MTTPKYTLTQRLVSFVSQSATVSAQNEAMSARNSHLEIENESLKSEIKNVRADYGALQTDMNDVRDYYHQVDIAASKMGHRCEVCMRPVFYSDHSQKITCQTLCDKRENNFV